MFEDAGQRRFDVRQEGHENHHSDKEVIRDKGDPSKLFAFVEEHLIGGRKDRKIPLSRKGFVENKI